MGATIKYTNLNDTDMIYLWHNSAQEYCDVISGESNKWHNVQWYGTFKAPEWAQRRIKMIYQRINEIRKKYKLLAVRTGAPLEDCWEGMPPQKLHVL